MLVNNAGGMPSKKVITTEGNEANFAGNHLGPFLLTRRLIPPLRAAEEGADTLIWLATAAEPGQSSGGYFFKRGPRAPNPFVSDEINVDRLWEESEKLVAAEKA